jgi:serine/threonine protein kinase
MHQANILFDSAGIPRIADFGISSITLDPFSSNASSPFHGYSLRWAAPEILEAQDDQSRRPTKMSDVYAFGMVVVEVRCHHHFRRLTL